MIISLNMNKEIALHKYVENVLWKYVDINYIIYGLSNLMIFSKYVYKYKDWRK